MRRCGVCLKAEACITCFVLHLDPTLFEQYERMQVLKTDISKRACSGCDDIVVVSKQKSVVCTECGF